MKTKYSLQLLPFSPPSFHLQYFWNTWPRLQSPFPDPKGLYPLRLLRLIPLMVVMAGCQLQWSPPSSELFALSAPSLISLSLKLFAPLSTLCHFAPVFLLHITLLWQLSDFFSFRQTLKNLNCCAKRKSLLIHLIKLLSNMVNKILIPTSSASMLTSPKLFPVFSSVAQSCPALCDPMNRNTPGLPVHHQRPTPRVYPNSCPLSRGCHPAISSSVIPFSSRPQSFPASGSFQMSQLFTSGGQSITVSPLTSVLPMNTQDWSPLGWIGWISLQSKGLSRVFSNTTVQKHQFFSAQLSSIHDHWKNHSLD